MDEIQVRITEQVEDITIVVSEAVKGDIGLSAYDYAIAAGYEGTPEQFAGDLASIPMKVDKIDGKRLSTEDYSTQEKQKLAGVDEGANKYVHPATHPALMIEEDDDHVFVTLAERQKIHQANTDNALRSPDKARLVAYTDNAGNLHVAGNINQSGEAYETHAEHLYTANDEIITRNGAEAGLADGEYTGIRAKKYDGANDGRLGFDRYGIARVGDVGDEQPLATREESPVNGGFAYWDAAQLKFKTFELSIKQGYDAAVSWISTNGQNLIEHLLSKQNPHTVTKAQVGLGSCDNTSDADKPVSTAQQTALADKQDRLLQTLADATSIDWNAQQGSAVVTLAGNRTMNNPSNLVAGGRYVLIVKQDAAGSRGLLFSACYKFPGAVVPVLTQTAWAVDIFEFFAESTSILFLTNFIPDVK